ncbi:MAG: hypothetical protein IPH17_04905 [Bacteroidales bacterium]|nr:hypothetical protein [Bacteroidales bacterium]
MYARGQTLRACAAELASAYQQASLGDRIISALRTFENNVDFYGIIGIRAVTDGIFRKVGEVQNEKNTRKLRKRSRER